VSTSPAGKPQLWFLIEIWYDIRERFKALIGDGLLFIAVLGILEIVDLILARMHYPADLKHLLEATHFWGSFSVLLILVVDLIAKILLSSWRPK
jgi:hypothetical protein